MAGPRTIRKRIEAQGFRDLDDPTLAELGPWIRWSPALCAAVMVVGVTLRSPLVLWALAGVAGIGAILPFHPFDLIYNHVVRRFTGTRPLPHNGPQRHFACALAATWLVATGWAFVTGADVLGLVLGVALTSMAVLTSVTHICVPSLIYNALLRRPLVSSCSVARDGPARARG
ncbi:MAG TPA: DUF4395 domain-containing protein [Gemmatimonadaceae bacterium]